MSSFSRYPVRAAALFAIAFILTNIVNTAVTLAYQSIARLPYADEVGLSWLEDPAYQATVPWHALIAFLVFTVAALWLPWRGAVEAFRTGAIWALICIAIDAAIYVAILGQTRWGLPASDFYVGNQPWITLTYIGVLLAPVAAEAARTLLVQRPSHRA